MPITATELRLRLKQTRSKTKAKLAAALKHEQWVRMHSVPVLNAGDITSCFRDHLLWVKSLLPADKYATYENLLKFPLDTVSFLEEVYQALEKVWDGVNPVYDPVFTRPRDLEDWMMYREQELHEPRVWRETGMSKIKSGINSAVVVDMAETATDPKPRPYFYFLDCCDIVDYEPSKRNEVEMEWIAFVQPGAKLAVFDDEWYRVYEYKDSVVGNVVTESSHGLGVCPVRWLWSVPLSVLDPTVRMSVVSLQLAALEWLLFFGTAKKHLDLFAPYTIYWGMEQNCDYEVEIENAERVYCDGGFLYRDGSGLLFSNGAPHQCPVCSTKRLAGPGSFIEVSAPASKEDPAVTAPVGSIPVDAPSLEYNRSELAILKREIRDRVCGSGGEAMNSQAQNEIQIQGNFEAKTTALLAFARPWESVMTWTDAICCRLRYGASFKSVTVSLGTEFYLATATQIMAMYQTAKTAQMSASVLTYLEDRYYTTLYRNNASALNRTKMVLALDPFRHLSTAEAKTLVGDGVADVNDYAVKANLETLIGRFERENGPLQNYVPGLDFDTRVRDIYEIISSYIKVKKDDTTRETGTAATRRTPGQAEGEEPEPEPEPAAAGS